MVWEFVNLFVLSGRSVLADLHLRQSLIVDCGSRCQVSTADYPLIVLLGEYCSDQP